MGHDNSGIHIGDAANLYGEPDFSWDHYHKYRPQYPDQLFDLINQYMNDNNRTGPKYAVDYGSGTGVIVPRLFDRCGIEKVLATDLNARQLEEGKPRWQKRYGAENFDILAGPAGSLSSIANNSVDLVVAATASHWFDQEAWKKEVFRILKPSGTLAIFTYGVSSAAISHPKTAVIFHRIVMMMSEHVAKPLNVPLPVSFVASLPLGELVLNPTMFSHQKRLRWFLTENIMSQIDPMELVNATTKEPVNSVLKEPGFYTAIQSENSSTIQDFLPSKAEDVFIQARGWTTEDVRQFYYSIGLPFGDFFERDDVKQAFSEIEDIVGGPEGKFDFGWVCSMLLATRAGGEEGQ